MNKYQEALDTLNNFVSNDGASCDQDVLENAIKTLQELINAFFKTTKTDYQEAIDVLVDRELDDVEKMAVKDLENLIYQYKMRLADAELLNNLRSITGTTGDLDLKTRINELLEKEKKYAKVHNELCMQCGRYRREHLNACAYCDFYER